jgi:hypothetical protein
VAVAAEAVVEEAVVATSLKKLLINANLKPLTAIKKIISNEQMHSLRKRVLKNQKIIYTVNLKLLRWKK